MSQADGMSRRVDLGVLSRLARTPWYLAWRVVEKAFYSGKTYSLQIPFGHRVFTPWFSNDADLTFSRMMADLRAEGPVTVSSDRCYVLYQLARMALLRGGDVAECGVYKGGTAQLLAMVMAEHGSDASHLHLFDSFEGMPAASDPSRDYHSPGDFSDTSLALVKKRLMPYDFWSIHVGFMPETFGELDANSTFSFVHIDVDIYPSALDCCNWFWPRLKDGGVFLFDDYGFFPYRNGIRAAVDEFFENRSEKPIALPTGQAFVIKYDGSKPPVSK